MRRSLFISSVITLALVACGGTDNTGTGGSGSTGTTGSSTSSGAATGSSSSSGSSSSGGGGMAPMGLAMAGTYVTLGDSISAGFGIAPYYEDLLMKNDDATYPTWKGKDFSTKYPGIKFINGAVGGTTSSGLLAQVDGLPKTLAGPVVVTITIGGNDIQSPQAIQDVLAGTDSKEIAAMQANLSAALTALTKADRFGAGVEVYVFEADIYDPTDGLGDFAKEGCPFPLSLLPVTPTTPIFARWNAVVDAEVPKHGMSVVEPMNKVFMGHGLNNKIDNWFSTADCIHPNAKGHNAIRTMMWNAITGDSQPQQM